MMYNHLSIISFVLVAVTSAVAYRQETGAPFNQPGMKAVTFGIAKGGALDLANAGATQTGFGGIVKTPSASAGLQSTTATPTEPLTINIVNKVGIPLSMSFGSNVGCPTPLGGGRAGTLSTSTQVLMPTGWAGRITIGKNFDPMGSKIEASLMSPDYQVNVDVSYVDGYSVPITCSCSDVVVTGCNIPLFHNGNVCPDEKPGPVCYNAQQNIPDGPATPFFEDCLGAAYTFPNDNYADVGCANTRTVNCCVGSQCDAPVRQLKNQVKKRS